jgi:hypothetical protein
MRSEMNDSVILTDPEMKEAVKSFVEEEGRVIGYKLAYRGSRHGWMAVDFHRHCDNVGPTLVIIKTTFNKVLGGFTKSSWDQSGTYKTDATFIFQADIKKKFRPN